MDNSQQATGPGVPLQPTINPPGGLVEQPKGSGKGIWIIVLMVILILLVGGLFWYRNNRKSTATPVNVSQNAAGTPQSVDSLDKDLNSTSLDDLDKQFTQVDTDLGSL